MALVRCILGKFLGVVWHCFPPRLDVPTFAARYLHVHNDARYPSSERRNYGREFCSVILPKWRLPRHLWNFYIPQIYDMGPTALLPLRRKACWVFFALKNPSASAGFEPMNLGTKGQHATPRPSQPLLCLCIYRMSHELRSLLRESVPYVKIYRYNQKHLCPKLNGYGDNGHRNVWASGVSSYCTPSVTSYSSNARARHCSQRTVITR
jgi:hypothetical protein